MPISPGPWLVTRGGRVIDSTRTVLNEESMKLVAACPRLWELCLAVASGAPMTEEARAIVSIVQNAPWQATVR